MTVSVAGTRRDAVVVMWSLKQSMLPADVKNMSLSPLQDTSE